MNSLSLSCANVRLCSSGDPVLGPNHKKITTMGHGDHVTVSQIYGVGIAAHGDDAYKLGTASLWQTVGGNKWIQKFVADGLDLCISTNDPGCKLVCFLLSLSHPSFDAK